MYGEQTRLLRSTNAHKSPISSFCPMLKQPVARLFKTWLDDCGSHSLVEQGHHLGIHPPNGRLPCLDMAYTPHHIMFKSRDFELVMTRSRLIDQTQDIMAKISDSMSITGQHDPSHSMK